MTATPADEDERLAALAALDLLDSPAEERFDRVTRLCTRLFGVSKAAVTLVDRDRVWVKSGAGLPSGDTARGDAFCSVTIQQAVPLVVSDTQQDERFATIPLVREAPHLRFYAGAPLTGPNGQAVGALCLFDESPRELSEREVALLSDLAGWVQKELAADEELDRAAEVQRGLLPSGSHEVPDRKSVV